MKFMACLILLTVYFNFYIFLFSIMNVARCKYVNNLIELSSEHVRKGAGFDYLSEGQPSKRARRSVSQALASSDAVDPIEKSVRCAVVQSVCEISMAMNILRDADRKWLPAVVDADADGHCGNAKAEAIVKALIDYRRAREAGVNTLSIRTQIGELIDDLPEESVLLQFYEKVRSYSKPESSSKKQAKSKIFYKMSPKHPKPQVKKTSYVKFSYGGYHRYGKAVYLCLYLKMALLECIYTGVRHHDAVSPILKKMSDAGFSKDEIKEFLALKFQNATGGLGQTLDHRVTSMLCTPAEKSLSQLLRPLVQYIEDLKVMSGLTQNQYAGKSAAYKRKLIESLGVKPITIVDSSGKLDFLHQYPIFKDKSISGWTPLALPQESLEAKRAALTKTITREDVALQLQSPSLNVRVRAGIVLRAIDGDMKPMRESDLEGMVTKVLEDYGQQTKSYQYYLVHLGSIDYTGKVKLGHSACQQRDNYNNFLKFVCEHKRMPTTKDKTLPGVRNYVSMLSSQRHESVGCSDAVRALHGLILAFGKLSETSEAKKEVVKKICSDKKDVIVQGKKYAVGVTEEMRSSINKKELKRYGEYIKIYLHLRLALIDLVKEECSASNESHSICSKLRDKGISTKALKSYLALHVRKWRFQKVQGERIELSMDNHCRLLVERVSPEELSEDLRALYVESEAEIQAYKQEHKCIALPISYQRDLLSAKLGLDPKRKKIMDLTQAETMPGDDAEAGSKPSESLAAVVDPATRSAFKAAPHSFFMKPLLLHLKLRVALLSVIAPGKAPSECSAELVQTMAEFGVKKEALKEYLSLHIKKETVAQSRAGNEVFNAYLDTYLGSIREGLSLKDLTPEVAGYVRKVDTLYKSCKKKFKIENSELNRMVNLCKKQFRYYLELKSKTGEVFDFMGDLGFLKTHWLFKDEDSVEPISFDGIVCDYFEDQLADQDLTDIEDRVCTVANVVAFTFDNDGKVLSFKLGNRAQAFMGALEKAYLAGQQGDVHPTRDLEALMETAPYQKSQNLMLFCAHMMETCLSQGEA